MPPDDTEVEVAVGAEPPGVQAYVVPGVVEDPVKLTVALEQVIVGLLPVLRFG